MSGLHIRQSAEEPECCLSRGLGESISKKLVCLTSNLRPGWKEKELRIEEEKRSSLQ